MIKGKQLIVISANQTKDILFQCFSFGLGKYFVPVYIIVNDDHIFDTTIFAEVVPMTLRCNQTDVKLGPADRSSIIEISNPVNVSIKFQWEVQDTNFVITPESGFVLPRSTMLCEIKAIPVAKGVSKTELYLISQSTSKHIVTVNCYNDKASLLYNSDEIVFSNIPLNTAITKSIVVKNISNQNVILEVADESPIRSVSVTPGRVLLKAKSNCFFRIIAHFRAVMSFTCTVRFCQQDVYIHEIAVSGNVVYPYFDFQPNSIQFAKIPSLINLKRAFQVTNRGITQNTLQFDFRRYPGVSVVDNDFNILPDKITLKPKETMSLHLQFQPTEPVVYSFFLPFILNGLMGPPLLNDPKSLKSAVYYKCEPCSEIICEPLPIVRVRCTSGAQWVKFSTLSMNFNYQQDKGPKKFVIQNVHTVEFIVFLSLTLLEGSFKIALQDFGGKFKETETLVKILLHPQEKAKFSISFTPEEFGEFEVSVPIAIDIFRKDEPFNYLYLHGKHPKPEIESSVRVIWFQTIQTNATSTATISLRFLYHHEKCKLNPPKVYDNFVVSAKHKNFSPYESTNELTVVFCPKSEEYFSLQMEFSCTCKCSISLDIEASASNASCLSYDCPITSPMQTISGNAFPYTIVCSNKKNVQIDSIITALEGWISTQCFFCQELYLIPSTIARYPFGIYFVDKKKKSNGDRKKKRQMTLPIVTLIVNRLDKSVMKYLVRE